MAGMARDEEKTNPYQSPLSDHEDDIDNWLRWRLFWRTAFFACFFAFAIFFEGKFALRELLLLTFAGFCAIGWMISHEFSNRSRA